MSCWATSIDSLSSGETVPSFMEAERKSIIARARRFFESEDCLCVKSVSDWGGEKHPFGRYK